MYNLNFRRFFAGFCLLLFTGCAVTPDPTDSTPMTQYQDWRLRGKLALFLPNERVSANLNWQHQGSQGSDQLKLTTALGTTILSMDSEPGQAEINIDGKQYRGRSAEALIQRLTGWQLPLSELSRFLLGNVGDAQNVEYDDDRRPKRLTLTHPTSNEQWQLEYQGWQLQSGFSVPRRIELRHPNQRIKLALSNWQPGL